MRLLKGLEVGREAVALGGELLGHLAEDVAELVQRLGVGQCLAALAELGHHLREGCKALPDPKPMDQFGYVFSEMTDEIREQRDGFQAYLDSFESEGAH